MLGLSGSHLLSLTALTIFAVDLLLLTIPSSMSMTEKRFVIPYLLVFQFGRYKIIRVLSRINTPLFFNAKLSVNQNRVVFLTLWYIIQKDRNHQVWRILEDQQCLWFVELHLGGGGRGGETVIRKCQLNFTGQLIYGKNSGVCPGEITNRPKP